MQDIVVLLFMFITRIGLPLGLVIGAGYLVNRWYSRQEITETAETAEPAEEQAQAAAAGRPKLREVKRRVA